MHRLVGCRSSKRRRPRWDATAKTEELGSPSPSLCGGFLRLLAIIQFQSLSTPHPHTHAPPSRLSLTLLHRSLSRTSRRKLTSSQWRLLFSPLAPRPRFATPPTSLSLLHSRVRVLRRVHQLSPPPLSVLLRRRPANRYRVTLRALATQEPRNPSAPPITGPELHRAARPHTLLSPLGGRRRTVGRCARSCATLPPAGGGCPPDSHPSPSLPAPLPRHPLPLHSPALLPPLLSSCHSTAQLLLSAPALTVRVALPFPVPPPSIPFPPRSARHPPPSTSALSCSAAPCTCPSLPHLLHRLHPALCQAAHTVLGSGKPSRPSKPSPVWLGLHHPHISPVSSPPPSANAGSHCCVPCLPVFAHSGTGFRRMPICTSSLATPGCRRRCRQGTFSPLAVRRRSVVSGLCSALLSVSSSAPPLP